MLPLDLHVLGLSLAFILSQDQTLRCMISFTFFHNLLARDGDFYSSRTTFFVYCNFFKDRLLFFIRKRTANLRVSFLFSKKNPSFFHCCPSLPKSVCKSKNFHSYLQIFLALFLYTYNKYFYNCLQITLLYTKLFSNKKLHKTEIISY